MLVYLRDAGGGGRGGGGEQNPKTFNIAMRSESYGLIFFMPDVMTDTTELRSFMPL